MDQLNQLLQLFDIKELNEESLRIAKKKVLMLHPDKNTVDTTKHFVYFKSEYEKLIKIYNYIHHETDENNFKKSHDIDKTFKDFIEKKGYTPTKNLEMYSKHFNEMFENIHIKDDEGYDKWLKSDEDIYDKDDLEKSRKKLMSNGLIKIDKIESAYSGNNGYSDLKDAHVNTIIGLDKDELYKDRPQFKTVTEYEIYRQKNMGEGLSERENLKIIADQEELEKKQALELSYNLMKKDEEMKKKHKEYIARYLMIK
jgi:hypothetical protein